jgi:predicted signal transduction protein with EAL and GGDEF domain
MLARADAALYHAKTNGRNAVSLHDGRAIVAYSRGGARQTASVSDRPTEPVASQEPLGV